MVHAKKPVHVEPEDTPATTANIESLQEEEKEEKEEGPVPAPSTFLASPTMRTIVRILLNGRDSRHSMRPFLRHDELMQAMLRAYEQRDRDAFLQALHTYLEMAVLTLPHGGYSSHVDPLVNMVRSYIDNPHCGFAAIATCILSVRYAPA